MAETIVSDVVEPVTFNRYVIERTAELSALIQSGIVGRDALFDSLAGNGGRTIHMPFWQDISGNSQVLSDTADLNTKKIGSSEDEAAIHRRGDAWSVNDLAGRLAGEVGQSDPMRVIGDLVAEYWNRDHQDTMVSTLKGVFAASDGSMAGNEHDIASESIASQSSSTRLNATTFEDAIQLMGDAKASLSGILMHSATESALVKQQLIDFIPSADGQSQLPFFRGKRVIVDDSAPTRAGTTDGTVYTTYVFGTGALAMGFATNTDVPVDTGVGTWAVEFQRAGLGGKTHLINRRQFILHPRGVKWLKASVAGISPTNAEIETGTNWSLVWEAKNVRIVAIQHNN